MTAQYVLSSPGVEIVFSGRVVEIARTGDWGYRATFDVDRVWKGTAPRRLDLYVCERAAEMPHWVKDQHAIVLAARLTRSEARRDFGIDANQIAFAPTQCTGNFVAHIGDDLGSGYPPTNPAEWR
jgi:hypothetical protein